MIVIQSSQPITHARVWYVCDMKFPVEKNNNMRMQLIETH